LENSHRIQYLQAMGVDVWTLKKPLPAVPTCLQEPGVTDDNAVREFNVADNAQQAWTELEAEVAACTRCALCETRKNTVFGSGNQQADWLVIGEGPGQSEDEQGLPFVGRAGQLLTEMLRAAGLPREQVFITNVVKCRPPGNRDPKPEEAGQCHDYLQRQIALIRPKIILAVGRISAQVLLNTDAPVSRLRGKVHFLHDIPLVVVYHPAYLLRSLLEKRKAWQDLLLAMRTAKER
jgi:uracil-DNA glycosylase